MLLLAGNADTQEYAFVKVYCFVLVVACPLMSMLSSSLVSVTAVKTVLRYDRDIFETHLDTILGNLPSGMLQQESWTRSFPTRDPFQPTSCWDSVTLKSVCEPFNKGLTLGKVSEQICIIHSLEVASGLVYSMRNSACHSCPFSICYF